MTISNCSNNYGPYRFPEKLIPLMIVNAITGQATPIYGDGRNSRDWLYVEDHCAALALVLQKGRLGETYNIGGGQEMANVDLVGMLCDEIDRRFSEDKSLAARFRDCPGAVGRSCRELITFVKDRPGHDRRYAICADRTSRELGFRGRRRSPKAFHAPSIGILRTNNGGGRYKPALIGNGSNNNTAPPYDGCRQDSAG